MKGGQDDALQPSIDRVPPIKLYIPLLQGERWNRRTAFHAALIHYTKELGITYYNSLQPIRYWQEDLDAPPIMDDDDGDDLDDLRSPLSPIDGNSQIPAPMPPAQPLLGFLPPEGSTVRRRKGRSRKTNMAGVGA